MNQKVVVDLQKEPGAVAAQAPAKPKKISRFKKIKFPLAPVKLGGGETIEFHTVPLGSGGNSKFGLFETEDPKLTDKLRAVVKAKTQHVFEV